MSDLWRSRSRLWSLASVGLLGSLLIAFAGPRAVAGPGVNWWYLPGRPPGRGTSLTLVYVGMALLCLAWLGLGRRLARPAAPGLRVLLVIGVLWGAPLALGPALFSRDLYSYLAQGTLLHLGLNPYHYTPAALAGLGHGYVLAAVSPFWRHTPAPYGPLFLQLISLVVGITGSHLIAGVLVIRGLELVGIVLLARFVPRLARALGSDPARAMWLAVLSPLTLLELVGAGHNDLLMIGLLIAGVAWALEGKPLLGIAACALAAMIKVPALAGAVFITVAWARSEIGRRAQMRFLLGGAVLTAGVLAVISLASGLGVSWLSSTVFSAPAKVRLAITPSTGLGWTISALLHDVGIAADSHAVESAFGGVALALTAGLGLVLLFRVRVSTLVPYLAVLLLAAAAGGPAAWPWYFTWGLMLAVALRGVQDSPALAVAIAASVFLVKPGGILALPLHTAPAVIAVYVLIAAAWYSWTRRGGDHGPADRSPPKLVDDPPSALVRT